MGGTHTQQTNTLLRVTMMQRHGHLSLKGERPCFVGKRGRFPRSPMIKLTPLTFKIA